MNTQYAEAEAKKMSEDADYVADMERLELLQTEGQAIIEDFEKNQETLLINKKLKCRESLKISRPRSNF